MISSLIQFLLLLFVSFFKDTHGSPDHRLNEQTKNIAAGVVVIGSLICGLLIALLIFRRRSRREYISAVIHYCNTLHCVDIEQNVH